MNIKHIPKENFIEATKNSTSMAEAANMLGLHFNSFQKYAKLYGCYLPNKGAKGIKKTINNKVEINDIKTRAGIRKRIIKDNLISYECGECGIKEWKGKKLSLHLDHINGMSNDHRLENLRFLCPNCHSLTDTYTGKNK